MSKSYTEEEKVIANAILYGKLQENPNWQAIVDKFDVNYRRMLARKNGRGDHSKCGGRNKALTVDQEADLICIINNIEHREIHYRYKIISSITDFILINTYNNLNTSLSIVGKN